MIDALSALPGVSLPDPQGAFYAFPRIDRLTDSAAFAVDLLRETNVVAVRADDVYVTVVIEERQPLIGTSRLMMMLGAKDYQLKQWTVTDPQGYDTTVAVSSLDSSKRPDPGMFRIDYTRYAQ